MPADGARPPLLLRADGDARIGLGHVMRCLALGVAWRAAGGAALLLGAVESPAVRARIAAAGLGLTRLDRPHPDPADLATTRDRLAALAAAGPPRPWLALDGYPFDAEYHRAVRAAGARLLVIDDCAHLPAYAADVLLNQNLGAEQLPYRSGPDALLLLGPQYAVLRPEFRTGAPSREPAPVARRVLVTLGGGDDGGATRAVVEALGRARVDGLEVTVVVGPASPREAELAAAARASRVPVRLVRDAPNMAELMREADLAVAAGGTTAWELCALGVPSVVLVLADNQAPAAARLAALGVAVTAGPATDLVAADLGEAVVKLVFDAERRRHMSELGRLLVDGRGVDRVLAALDAVGAPGDGPPALRPAAPEDVGLLWLWANDPATRANSFSRDAIPWETHRAWYRAKLASPDSRLWLLEWRRVPVGQIRYDRVDGGTARISFAVAPGYRGRGLGTRLLALSAERACRELAVGRLEGITLARNAASARAFVAAGFAQAGEPTVDGEPCLVFARPCAAERG